MSGTSFRISRFRCNPVIARGAPFLLFIGLLILGSYFSPVGSPNASAPWLVTGRGAIVALALVWFWPGYVELRKIPTTHPAHWLFALIIGFLVFLIWIYFDQDWAVWSRSPGFSSLRPDGTTDWQLGLARLAGIALVVPVMEELFWRSLVLRWIEKHDFLAVVPAQIGMRAFLITTVLFSLEHDRWFAGALAGIAYNWLYMRSGNLWVPILAHVVTNAALGIWILHTQNWQFW
jgi:CAAX prenyl protease-like protein